MKIKRTISLIINSLLMFALISTSVATKFGSNQIQTAHASQTIPGIQLPTRSILDPSTNKMYVFGVGSVAVINAATGSLIKYLPIPVDSAQVQLFVNPSTNLVFAFINGTMIYTIDSTTDTVIRTTPLVNGAIGMYNPVTDRLYISQVDPSGVGMNLAVFNASTMAQIDSISETLANVLGISQGASYMTINPANNKIYLVYASSTASGLKVIDGNTDTVLSQTTCDFTACNAGSLRLNGTPLSIAVNPIDNSVWISTDGTFGGVISGAEGHGGGIIGGSSATITNFFQISPVTDHVSNYFSAYGLAYIFGIDPTTGLFYGIGSHLLVGSADPTTAITDTGINQDLITVDPTAATPVMTLVTPDDSRLTPIPGSSFYCGTGTIGALGILAVDFTSGNIYWRCDATSITNSSIIITKTSYTPRAPGVLFPPTNVSTFTAQVPTTAANTFFNPQNYGILSIIGAPNNPTNAADQAVFFSSSEDKVVTINPIAQTATTTQLTAPIFIPDPPTYIVSGSVTNSAGTGFAGVNVTITDGAATNVTVTTDAAGKFTFSGILAGTYNVSYDSTGLIPAGVTSRAVTVSTTAVTGINFQAATTVNIASVTIPAVSGFVLNFGPGQSFGTVISLNQPAPAGGIVVNLVASNAKALKVPLTATVAAGQTTASFTASANGVTVATPVTISASYQGTFNTAGTSGVSPVVTVYPSDSTKITSATWSTSSKLLTMTATDPNFRATLTVTNNSGLGLGTMVNNGDGTYSFQTTTSTSPGTVKIFSDFGTNTSLGVKTIN